MKTWLSVVLSGVLALNAFGATTSGDTSQQTTPPAVPSPTPYAVVNRAANSRVWERTTYEPGPSGQVAAVKHHYTELASGLNYQQNGRWLESKEEIDIQPNGTASATQGQHQAYFPGDIYQGEIEMVTSDGVQLRSRPVGLSYFDGTNSVLIAELTNSIGQVMGANQVIYTNAFTGFAADLLYTYTKDGFEQDIILRESPLTPESYGLNPATARLQVLTEFFSSPEPVKTTKTLPEQAGVTLTDDTLDFGSEEMIPGRAFLLGADAEAGRVMVSKKWLLLDGRQFLVEEVPVDALADALATLPSAQEVSAQSTTPAVSRKLQLPAQHLAKTGTSKQMMRLAQVPKPMTGVMLDYQTMSGTVTNFIFQGDTTYYISANLNLKGTNNIEGGAVIKYSALGQITVGDGHTHSTALNSRTTAYRPVIFTAVDDNSVGETISGSTGNPSGYYGGGQGYVNFNLDLPDSVLFSNFRIAYAQLGIQTSGRDTFISDGQFINCKYAVNGGVDSILLRNVLCINIQTNFFNSDPNTLDLQNVTFANIIQIFNNTGLGNVSWNLTNCIFANVTSLTNASARLTFQAGYNGFYNSPAFGANTFTNTSYPFQAIGAGNYYLTNGCNFRDVGSSNIDSTLLAELQQETTYPPVVYSNSIISTNLTLNPQVLRDTNNTPDLGYHYDPLDYAFGGVYVTNATITVNPGVVIGIFGTNGGTYGLGIGANAQFQCQGQATNLIRIVEYNTVQEQAGSVWRTAIGGSVRDSQNVPETAINCRFTDWSAQAQDAPHLYGSNSVAINLQDCQFHGGKLQSYFPTINLTNCLLERVNTDIEPQDGRLPSIRNNLIWNGTFGFRPGAVTNAVVKDNLFDHATIPDWIGGVGNTYNGGYNAYISGSNLLHPAYASDVILSSSPVYNVGLFGNYYLPAGSLLIDAGSTTAGQVGLYHYTTQTNQVPETNTIVDIGYHYVTTMDDATGDGIPDYLEDGNGDGVVDNAETNWALTILTQPVSQTAIQTSSATFSVAAIGVTPISYQWYFNSSPVANATNSTLTINDVLTNNVGTYYVVVTNSGISLTSSNAALAMLIVPTISITNPADGAVFIASLTNITLGAMAADMAGIITQVQFFQGTTGLGITTNQPYGLVWSNVTTGAYALTAQATDNNGLTSTSAIVNIVVEPLFTTNNLAVWLKADTITGLTNNAQVDTWSDSSGWGHSAHSFGPQEPIFVTNIINGEPIVRFAAFPSVSFSLPNGLLNGTTGIEAIAVLKVKVAKPSQSRVLWQLGASGSLLNPSSLAYPDTNGIIADDFGSTNAQTVGNPVQALDQFHVYEVAGATNYWAAWINSELQVCTTNNPYGINSHSYILGKQQNGGNFDGDIAEVVIFSRILTAGERDAVNGYLNLKYAFVTTPPAPTNLMATTVSATQIGLTWSFGLTNTSTVFKIERMTQLGGFYAPCATVRDATSYVDTNLLVGTKYYYRVRASNAAGDSGYSNEAQTTTLANGTDIPFGNLILWLKADNGIVRQGTNGGIKTWFDQSGNYSDGNQGTATNQPLWFAGVFNGRPVVGFSATNSQYLTLPSQLFSSATGAEAMVVLKAAVAVPGIQRQLWRMGSSGSASLAYPDTSGNIVDDFGSTTAQAVGTTQPLDHFRIYNVAGANGYRAAWINSQQLGTGNNTFGISTNYALGYGTNAYFDGDIAEVLIFNRVLAAAERDAVKGYLTNKYQSPMPTNLLVTASNSTQLNISWTDAAQFVPVIYNVDRKIGSGGMYGQIASVQNTYSFFDTNTMSDTNYYYRVRATNYFGQFISMEVSPPVVDVTNPLAGSILSLPNIPLGASASDSDGTVTQVQFLASYNGSGAANVVGTDTNSPYTVTWTNSFQGGYALSARAFDNGGNSRISAPITVATALDSNGDGIPDYMQVSQGNDPLNPWIPPAFNTNDHTAPIITLLIPTNAVIVP